VVIQQNIKKSQYFTIKKTSPGQPGDAKLPERSGAVGGAVEMGFESDTFGFQGAPGERGVPLRGAAGDAHGGGDGRAGRFEGGYT
jgi:hypothetical protein